MINKTTLKGIAEFIKTGKTPPTKEEKYFNGDVQWYTPGDLDRTKYLNKSKRTLTDESFVEKKAVQFPEGTLLVACIGDIGKIGITTSLCSSNQQITGIKPNSDTDVNYLYYWFKYSKKAIQHISNNAVVPIINNRSLEQIKISMPLLAEQKKIAEILDAADSLRHKDQQLIEHYTTLSQSLFLKMFGDPVINSMNWEEHLLSELTDFENGDRSSNYPSGNDIKSEGILFLSTKNISSHRMNLKSTQFINEEKFESLSRGKAIKNDLLITLRGTLGGCCIFNCKYDTAFINAQMMIIRTNNKILFKFLHSLITSEKFNAMLQYIGRGAAVPQLTASQLGKLKIFVPPVTLQHQFVECIEAIEKQKQQAQENLEKSEALFNSLLQRAFNGELTASKAA